MSCPIPQAALVGGPIPRGTQVVCDSAELQPLAMLLPFVAFPVNFGWGQMGDRGGDWSLGAHQRDWLLLGGQPA